MNAISNVTGQNISSYAPSTANSTQLVRSRDADSDDDDSKKTGRAERSNFLAAIEKALIQTLTNQSSTPSTSTTPTSGSTPVTATTATPPTNPSTTTTPPVTATTSTTPSPQEALKTFIHSLFSALHSAAHSSAATTNGTPTTSGTPATNPTPTTGGVPANNSGDADGDNDGSTASSRVRHHHGHGHGGLANKIQSLIQQLSTSTQSTPATGSQNTSTSTSQTPAATTTPSTTDPLSDLKASFQNLISAVAASQTQASANTTITLQTFLQNLLLDFNGGSSHSGTLINTQA